MWGGRAATDHLDWLATHGIVVGGELATLRGLAARGRHREALHIAFTCLGLVIKDAARSGDDGRIASTRVTATAWLARLGWPANVLTAKSHELDRFVERLCQVCLDFPG